MQKFAYLIALITLASAGPESQESEQSRGVDNFITSLGSGGLQGILDIFFTPSSNSHQQNSTGVMQLVNEWLNLGNGEEDGESDSTTEEQESESTTSTSEEETTEEEQEEDSTVEE